MTPACRSRRRAGLRGAVLTEMLIAIIPILVFIFGLLQLAEVMAGRILLDHAAFAAARSASVVQGEDSRNGGGNVDQVARLAAVRAIAPYALDGNFRKIEVSVQGGGKQLGAKGTVEIRATFQCNLPLVWKVLCDDGGTSTMKARAEFASNAAQYQFE